MNDPDSGKKSTTPPTNISIHNESEIKKWMANFQCTREDLLYAVNKIGSSTFKVEAKAILFFALLLATAHAEDQSVSWSPSSSFIPWFGHRSAEFKYDRRMIHAAEIAANRAYAKPTWRCWHFVKDALLEAGVISTRPVSPWAKQAGDELCSKFGFRKLPITNPKDAPVGSVLVYGGADAGHVELRTASGYVSDFISPTPYPRPLIGVYVKET